MNVRLQTVRKGGRWRELPAKARRSDFRRRKRHAEATEVVARQLCPRSDNNNPGHVHLEETIRVVADESKGSVSVVAGDPNRGVDYAVYVHEGTHLTEGTPFLREAGKAVTRRSHSTSVRLYT